MAYLARNTVKLVHENHVVHIHSEFAHVVPHVTSTANRYNCITVNEKFGFIHLPQSQNNFVGFVNLVQQYGGSAESRNSTRTI
jgi:hypothetical protein